jgi:hypothetical protein
VRQRVSRAFYPAEDAAWKEAVLGRGLVVLEQAISWLSHA